MTRAVILVALLGAACTGQIQGKSGVADPADASRPPVDAAVTPAVDAAVGLDAPPAMPPCTQVAHIGDSLTAYTVAPLTAAYADVGASAMIDAYGGRAILQKLAEDPKTGKQAALDFHNAGFAGCWVVAMGTNDTANVSAGASYSRAKTIDEMMTAIDPTKMARVLWVNVYTTRTSGHYDNANMVLYNQALDDARARWPNLRVFDWAAIAAGGTAPYADGIHHTTAGYAVRNAAIATALELLEK